MRNFRNPTVREGAQASRLHPCLRSGFCPNYSHWEGAQASRLHPRLRSGFCPNPAPSLTVGLLIRLPPKTRNHPLVHFSRHPHVVQIVFANFGESPGLIEFEDTAAFDLRSLA